MGGGRSVGRITRATVAPRTVVDRSRLTSSALGLRLIAIFAFTALIGGEAEVDVSAYRTTEIEPASFDGVFLLSLAPIRGLGIEPVPLGLYPGR
jgi:hypothetical protein